MLAHLKCSCTYSFPSTRFTSQCLPLLIGCSEALGVVPWKARHCPEPTGRLPLMSDQTTKGKQFTRYGRMWKSNVEAMSWRFTHEIVITGTGFYLYFQGTACPSVKKFCVKSYFAKSGLLVSPNSIQKRRLISQWSFQMTSIATEHWVCLYSWPRLGVGRLEKAAFPLKENKD